MTTERIETRTLLYSVRSLPHALLSMHRPTLTFDNTTEDASGHCDGVLTFRN